MNPTEPQLRDCGHVGQMAGICQYNGCAKQLCPYCLQQCETCGRILCPAHQYWRDGGRRVLCEPHNRAYLIRTVVRYVLPGIQN
ncbi:hypothetical protein [Natronococcus occultus]|uniref:Uncharacterized protein n=1 Tax=Natronococcus occultus SP4 TaxID=694430 RepID=L0JXT4_9EURY|nr:hypothetical protein [Natronococcus occultus]AGB36914.1 hypothetical protein Natoc_1072 [Natronococcus occultus SP4]